MSYLFEYLTNAAAAGFVAAVLTKFVLDLRGDNDGSENIS